MASSHNAASPSPLAMVGRVGLSTLSGWKSPLELTADSGAVTH